MPDWWKKSKKNKDDHHSQEVEGSRGKLQLGKKVLEKSDYRGFEDSVVTRNRSPSSSRELPTGSSRFSVSELDSAEKRGLPLPQPIINDLNGGFNGSASNSVSSDRSSASSGEDHGTDHPGLYRGYHELTFSTGSRSPGPGSRSPAQGSRAASRPTSPLHPRIASIQHFGLESLNIKSDEGKGQCHPLPLPPSSPCTTSPNARLNGASESSSTSVSTWKKGKLIGRGTFGHVYSGFNSVTGQMCAIKEVKLVSDDQSSKECLRQLNQEINMLSQLSHQNIVRYYGSELNNETLSVYLEYVSGGSIHKLLQEYGAFKEPVIQNYTRQILAGLAYLHGRNTVHRDIKGANILVDPCGEIKLADFGMAKHITTCASMLSFKGSPYWMAPEVVMNKNGYSLPVDIWSLGCTILEMAVSKPPWSQYEGVAAIFKIGNSKEIPDIPDHLSINAKSFIKLCLQRDPSLRPTAQQLLDHSFIREQQTPRSPGTLMNGDSNGYTFDSSRSPPPLELQSRRTTNGLLDGDSAIKPSNHHPFALRSPRDDPRKITSLPVSPSSSPLRQFGHAHNNGFLSPPHPSYGFLSPASYNTIGNSSRQLRSSLTYPFDPYSDPPFLKAQNPGSSPRSRVI